MRNRLEPRTLPPFGDMEEAWEHGGLGIWRPGDMEEAWGHGGLGTRRPGNMEGRPGDMEAWEQG